MPVKTLESTYDCLFFPARLIYFPPSLHEICFMFIQMSDFSFSCWTADTRTDMSYSVAIYVILQSHENSNAILIKLSSLFSEDINHIRHEKKILGLKN
jgi:hypothetical protein